MNWHIITGILIVGIILGLVVIVPLSMKQNENPEIKVMESQPVPEERIIASFGLDENNPDRTVFLKNPDRLDSFLNASEADISPHYYPKGPVIGYGKDMHGSIVVMMDESQETNQTLVREIYDRISARGKTLHINCVPCKFISMGIVHVEVPKDTVALNPINKGVWKNLRLCADERARGRAEGFFRFGLLFF